MLCVIMIEEVTVKQEPSMEVEPVTIPGNREDFLLSTEKKNQQFAPPLFCVDVKCELQENGADRLGVKKEPHSDNDAHGYCLRSDDDSPNVNYDNREYQVPVACEEVHSDSKELEDSTSIDNTLPNADGGGGGEEEEEEEEEEEGEFSRAENYKENGDGTDIPSREIPPNPNSTFKAPPDKRTTRKRKGMKMETIQYQMEKAYRMFKNVSEKPDEDECSLYAELIAKKLRALDETVREIVMHEINNLMFCAKMQKQSP